MFKYHECSSLLIVMLVNNIQDYNFCFSEDEFYLHVLVYNQSAMEYWLDFSAQLYRHGV